MHKSWLLLLLLTAPAYAEDGATLASRAPAAFRRIQHRYSVFPAEQAKMSSEDARTVGDFLVLMNAAAVARIDAEAGIETRRGATAVATFEDRVADLKLEMKRFTTNGPLYKVSTKILGALDDEAAYFRDWAALKPGVPFNGGDAHVRSASEKIHQAYDALCKLYPHQPAAVQNSFYDPFCAFDFL